MKKFCFTILAFTLPLMVYLQLNIELPFVKALITTSIILWFFELIPLPVTGLFIPVAAALFNILPLKDAFAVFGNPILFLFLGSFLLARSMEKHHWDKRMVYLIFSRKFTSRSLERSLIVFFAICWILSFWISNTAACAIMAPMAIGLFRSLENCFENDRESQNFLNRILLGTAFSSSIGGIATPIGSPPNLMAIHFLAQKGTYISFTQWLLYGFPISAVMFLSLYLMLKILYPVKSISMQNIQENFELKLKEQGSLRVPEIQIALTFTVTVILWLLPGFCNSIFPDSIFSKWLNKNLPMSIVPLITSIFLFMLPFRNELGKIQRNLEASDLLKVSWQTILIFAGGLCLGKVLDHSGIAGQISGMLVNLSLPSTFITFLILFIAIAIIFSELGSNTASAAILLPIILNSNLPFLSDSATALQVIAIATAIGASFGFMLPVSTPPNAIVYSTGKVSLAQMKKTGILFDILGMLIIVGFALIWYQIQ